MADLTTRRDIALSMRIGIDELEVIDRGAEMSGLSRSEFMRRAAVQDAQMAILNQGIVRLSPDAFERFVAAIEEPTAPLTDAMRRRLSRSAPWS